MTNTYNDPVNQMKRLRSAGLNPNMVYGGSPGGTAGTASSLPGAKPAEVRNIDPSNEIMQYVGLKNTEAQTDNVHALKSVNDSLASLNKLRGITETAKAAELESNTEYKKAMTKLQGQQLLNLIKEEKLKDLEISDWEKGIKGTGIYQQAARGINQNLPAIEEVANMLSVNPWNTKSLFGRALQKYINKKVFKQNQ